MKRRHVAAGFAVIGIVGIISSVSGFNSWQRSLNLALDHYRTSQHAGAVVVADRVQNAIQSIYANIRTLSLLPGTRTVDRHAEQLSQEAHLTFQQVYNNLADSVSVSEVYVLPATLDPDRIDPVTGRPEEPVLMFDQLIADDGLRPSYLPPDVDWLTRNPKDAQIERFEYLEMKKQLEILKQLYPTSRTFSPLKVPMLVSRELITCDNRYYVNSHDDADRMGLIFTVPVYGEDQQLRGAVSAIILTRALNALLPAFDFALVNAANGFSTAQPGTGQQWIWSAEVRRAQPASGLLYSQVLPIRADVIGSSFALWVGRSDRLFWESADARGANTAAIFASILGGIVLLAMALTWALIIRHFRQAHRMNAELEMRVAERTAEIKFIATHDALTGLANRHRLTECLDELLGEGNAGRVALLCLDLDNFKAVNDGFGHPAGDQMLRQVALRLRGAVTDRDIVARLGGDEFVVLQVGETTPAAIEALARRIVDVIREPFDIDGQIQHVGASIGIAVAPTDGTCSEILLKNADIALYRAKGDGRGTFRFFEPAMDASLRARQALEIELRRAVEAEEFVVHYQPLVSASEERVNGFEALVRWQHADRGLVGPSHFIALAEDIGLIGRIGRFVLQRACHEARNWPEHCKVAVNLSPAQFRNKSLAADVVAALDSSGLAPHRLELEITESALLDTTADTLAILHQLRTLGVKIAMDDFGTGFSSLSYLRSFPFDRIKIDRSFISEIASNRECQSIVRAVAALGQNLGMTTTAEGIETLEQLLLVRAQGCTDLQGYYFSKPMPAADIPAYLRGAPILRAVG